MQKKWARAGIRTGFVETFLFIIEERDISNHGRRELERIEV
jgi:hypothetical protein